MKTKSLSVALLASAVTIAQANPASVHRGGGGVRAGTGGFHGGAVARSAPAVHAPMRAGGFSSFRSTPMRPGGVSSFHRAPARTYGSRPVYSGQRYSSFGMRSSPSSAYRRPYISPSRGSFTRSGPYTVATIPQGNRIAPFANRRSPAVTSGWNQRNTGMQFRNGNNLRNANNLRNGNNVRNANNHLRGDWQKHVFGQRSGDWHRDWDRHSDHWWNGHRCCFINGSWVIFSSGFDPWWPYAWYPPDYLANGSPYSGYNYPYSGYDDPYSYDYQPGYSDSGDYQGQTYYDQNSYPDQSQAYYDASVYQTEVDSDQNGYQDYSNYRTVAAAQERLAREGYYRGETDGALNPEMQKALRRYPKTNGLQPTGYLDGDTLALMGLR